MYEIMRTEYLVSRLSAQEIRSTENVRALPPHQTLACFIYSPGRLARDTRLPLNEITAVEMHVIRNVNRKFMYYKHKKYRRYDIRNAF